MHANQMYVYEILLMTVNCSIPQDKQNIQMVIYKLISGADRISTSLRSKPDPKSGLGYGQNSTLDNNRGIIGLLCELFKCEQ